MLQMRVGNYPVEGGTSYAHFSGGSMLSFAHPLIPWGQEHVVTYVACAYCGGHSDDRKDSCKSCGAPLPKDNVFAPLPKYKQTIPVVEEDDYSPVLSQEERRESQQSIWGKLVDYVRGW